MVRAAGGRWAISSGGDELRRLMHRPSTCGGPRRAAVPGVNASAGGCGRRPPALQWLARWYAAPPGWRCGWCRRSLSHPSRGRRGGCWLPCRRARPTGSAGSTGRGDAALARQSADGCHDLVGQGAQYRWGCRRVSSAACAGSSGCQRQRSGSATALDGTVWVDPPDWHFPSLAGCLWRSPAAEDRLPRDAHGYL